jgi:hypothetical protein
VEFVFQTPEAFGLFRDGLDVCLKDHLLRGRGTHHVAEPSQGGGTPVGPPCLTDIMPPQEGFELQLGRLQIPQGSVTRPTQVADGFIGDGRPIHGGEVPGAQEPGQGHGVTTIGCDPVARLFGDQRGSDDPADVVCVGQIPIEPIPTRAGFLAKDQGFGLCLSLPKQGVEVTRSGAKGPQGDDLGVLIVGDVGHRARLLMNIQSDVTRARRGQG